MQNVILSFSEGSSCFNGILRLKPQDNSSMTSPAFWMTPHLILLPIFFAVAILYSSVGLGGGSAYIAALVLAGVKNDSLPAVALGCNMLVAALGFLHFRQAGHFKWRLFWPLAISSMPLAYIGGSLAISEKHFIAVLSTALSIAGIRLLFWRAQSYGGDKSIGSERSATAPILIIIGATLGLLSGITGIGGGIYLIPILLIFHICAPKEASSIASLFIFVNSASGLAGQLSKNAMDWRLFLPLAAAVLVGGIIGSRLGARRLKGETIQKIVGVIMLIAAVKLAMGLL